MRRFEAVLFDLDGTLLDTSEGIVKSVKETIEHFDLAMLPDEELLRFIGPPIEWSFEGKCGVKADKLSEVCNYFRDRYSNHNLLMANLMRVSTIFLVTLMTRVFRWGSRPIRSRTMRRSFSSRKGLISTPVT